MGKSTDKLSAVALKNPKPGRHWDGLGLYLEVTEQGGRYWRLKYRHAGKEKRLALGVFPEVTLAEARQKRDAARALLRDGTDPSEHRKTQRDDAERSARGSFAAVAKSYVAAKAKTWAPESKRKAEYVLDTYLLPSLKSRPVATLSSKEVGVVLQRMAERTPDLARKAKQYINGVVKLAIRDGLRDDGRLLVLDGYVSGESKGHIPARTLPEEIAALMKAIGGYPAEVTRSALLMCAYTAQRLGMVASMRWDEIEQGLAEWRIPAARMKMRRPHIVPLPKQAVALLDVMKPYTAGREYVFPPLARQTTPHLHRDALSKALRIMGFGGSHSTHGFRAMLRTAGRERLGIDSEVIEAQLAHAKRSDTDKAYDRTTFNEQRQRAMQRWADWLHGLSAPATVTPICKRSGSSR